MDKVIRASEIIMQLEPKPGRGFDSEDTDYINPDVHVEKVGNDYVIRLNEDGLPKLRINSFYLEAMRGSDKLPEGVKSYIQKHLDNALWFIRSIHQRQKTLYKVTESIVRFQREFLDHGLSHSAAPDPTPGGRRRADARIHHQPGDHPKVRLHPPGGLRPEVLFQ